MNKFMNKKGDLPLDIVDLLASVLIFLVLMVLFAFFISSQKEAVERTLDEKALDVQRERFLIDYLKTPVKETKFGKMENKGVYGDIKTLADKSIAENYLMADLLVFTTQNKNYLEVLRAITRNEQDFVMHDLFVVYPDGKTDLINAGRCVEGDTSVAYLPLEDGTKVGVRVKLCTK